MNYAEYVLHIEELEQQLAEREKQIVLLREALDCAVDSIDFHGHSVPAAVIDALAATTDLSGLILCDGDPVAWMMDTEHKTSGEKSTWISTDPKGWTQMVSVTYREQHPLYKARKP